jgi:hypothetical protein
MHSKYTFAITSLILLQSSLAQQPPATTVTESKISVDLGATPFSVVKRVHKGKIDLVFFAPHDNESICVEAAEKVLADTGGTIIELKSQGENGQPDRYLNFDFEKMRIRIDPNRIFTVPGIILALKHPDGRNPEAAKTPGSYRQRLINSVQAFANGLLKVLDLDQQKMVVTLHNNWDGKTIWMTGYTANRRQDLYHWNKRLDEDDLFITTDDGLFNALEAAGYNVVIEGDASDDGSLSVFCSKKRPSIPYVNIEAQHSNPGARFRPNANDHLAQQQRMIEALVACYANMKATESPPRVIPRPIR